MRTWHNIMVSEEALLPSSSQLAWGLHDRISHACCDDLGRHWQLGQTPHLSRELSRRQSGVLRIGNLCSVCHTE